MARQVRLGKGKIVKLVGVNRRRVVGQGKTGQDKKTRQDKSRIKRLDRKTKKGNGGKNKNNKSVRGRVCRGRGLEWGCATP